MKTILPTTLLETPLVISNVDMNSLNRYRMFIPLLYGMLVVCVFQLATPYLFNEYFSKPTYSCHKYSVVVNSEAYIAFASTIILFFFQLTVTLFSIRTILKRKPQDDESVYRVSFKRYSSVSSVIFVFVFLVFIVIDKFTISSYSIFAPVLERISCSLGDIYQPVKLAKDIIDATALFTVTVLFVAMCSLVPTRVWDKNEERIDHALEQVSKQMRWLGYYFYVGVVYLVIGAFFNVSSLRWLGSYFPDCDKIHSLAAGISFYNTIFYVTALSVTVLPIAVRLRLAAVWVAEHKLGSMTESNKQRWLRDNGLSFPLTKTVQSTAALVSPLLVPLLSELL